MVLQILRLRVITLLDHVGRAPEVAPPLRTNLPTPPPEVVDGLAVTRDCVARIAALAASRGAKTGVLLLPARFQVDDEDFGYLQDQVRAAGDTLLRDKSSERFAEALRGLPVPLLDALPPLRAAARDGRVFFTDTAHLTVLGHQALADAIAPFLAASGLVAPGNSGR
jgi:lysophospholipase L1-like esterase